MAIQGGTRLGAGVRAALVISPERRMLSELAQLLSHDVPAIPVFELQSYPGRKALMELMGADAPNLCFLDVVSEREAALALITDLVTVNRSVHIVALMDANEPDLILRCLRQGASEFLLRPFTSEQLHPIFEKLAQLNTSQGGTARGKVYCVMPVKGACGATTIASNLSYQWKRLGSKKILLADLDPLTGTLSFILKLKWAYSFVDALSRSGNMDADIWKGLVAQSQGIDVLLSPENPMDHVHEVHDPAPVVDFCRELYDAVTVDVGAPYGEWEMSLARSCDELLLVTTNELPALRATQRALSSLEKNKVDRSKIRLLVNRYHRNVGLSEEAIETALAQEVYQVLPSDYDVIQRAIMEGKPIASSSSFGKSLSALAERLAGAGANNSTRKKTTGLGSLFSSLMSRR